MAWAKRALLIAALGGLSMMARPAVAQQDHGFWHGGGHGGGGQFEGQHWNGPGFSGPGFSGRGPGWGGQWHGGPAWRGPEGHARFEGVPGGWAYGRRDDVRAWGFAGEHRPGWDWRGAWGWHGAEWGAWNRESWAWDSLMVGVAAGFIIAPPVLFGPPPPTGDGRAEGSGAAMTAKV